MKKISAILVCSICIISIFLIAMGSVPAINQQKQEFERKTKHVEHILKNQPATQIDFSMDRYLLNERDVRLNDPTKMTYLYISFFDGTWLKITIRGKLASTSKRLSASVQEYIVQGDSTCSKGELGPAPDNMAVWGDSVGGKVGITTLGTLIEFGGMIGYIYSETPLIFSGLQKPIIEITTTLTDNEKSQFAVSLDKLIKESKKNRK